MLFFLLLFFLFAQVGRFGLFDIFVRFCGAATSNDQTQRAVYTSGGGGTPNPRERASGCFRLCADFECVAPALHNRAPLFLGEAADRGRHCGRRRKKTEAVIGD